MRYILILFFFLSSSTYAEIDFSKLELKEASLSLGLVSPRDIDSALGIGIGVNVGSLLEKEQWGVELDHWSRKMSIVDFSDTVLSLYGQYEFLSLKFENFTPFAKAALAFHLLSSEIDASSTLAGSDTELKMGMDLGVGVQYPFWSELDFSATMKYRLVSDINQFQIMFSANYLLK